MSLFPHRSAPSPPRALLVVTTSLGREREGKGEWRERQKDKGEEGLVWGEVFVSMRISKIEEQWPLMLIFPLRDRWLLVDNRPNGLCIHFTTRV